MQKREAAAKLAEIAIKQDKAKDIIATNNGIKPLVELLKSKDLSSQKTAATALKNLAYQNDSNKLLIGKEGAIKGLVAMLKSTDEEAKLKAATTITVLAFKNDTNKEQVAKEGGVQPLLEMLLSTNPKMIEEALSTLRNLAVNEKNKTIIFNEGGITSMINILKSNKSARALEDAIAILRAISNSSQAQITIAKMGGLRFLIELTNNKVADVKEQAIHAIKQLAQSEQIRDLIVKEGGGHIVEIVGLDAEHADGTKLPEKKNKKKKEEPRLTPKEMARVDTLVTKMKAQDAGALEAAKELAQLSQLGSHYKREILTKGAFDELWKYAKQGKFQWDDKWYEEVDLSKLTFDVKLGSGTFATVYRGTLRSKGKKLNVAIKCIDENQVPLEDLRTELVTMALISPVVPNMVKFKGYTYQPASKSSSIPTNYHVFVLELLDTTLETLLKEQYSLFTPMFIRHVAHGIAFGMQHVHSYNVLHRDLKSANILMKKTEREWVVKIADFGFARRDTGQSIEKSVLGTPAFLAPELFGEHHSKLVSRKSDVYSYGVILWELVTGKKPFDGMDAPQLYAHMAKCRTQKLIPLTVPTKCDPVIADLIKKCLSVDPKARPEFGHICLELVKI